MMNRKYLVLYLTAGSLALLLEFRQILITYPNVSFVKIAGYMIISLFFYYLAYKTYHEKKDGEMM
jgi:hypothetical protein